MKYNLKSFFVGFSIGFSSFWLTAFFGTFLTLVHLQSPGDAALKLIDIIQSSIVMGVFSGLLYVFREEIGNFLK